MNDICITFFFVSFIQSSFSVSTSYQVCPICWCVRNHGQVQQYVAVSRTEKTLYVEEEALYVDIPYSFKS